MKAIKTTLITILTVCMFFCTANAESTANVTLSVLRAATPTTVDFSIGGEVVSVPVVLPDQGKMPILYAEAYNVDKDALRSAFWDNAQTSSAEQGYLYLDNNSQWLYTNGMRLYRANGIADNNELTAEDVKAWFDKAVESAALPLEFRVDKVLARSVGYEYENETVSFPELPEKASRYNTKEVSYTETEYTTCVADTAKPIVGMGVGDYQLFATQMVHGTAVFRGGYINDRSVNSMAYQGTTYSVTEGGRAVMHMLDSEHWNLVMLGLVEPCGTIAEDALLAPFEAVAAAVQSRIDSGELCSVDGIELGYSVALRVADGGFAKNPAYVLVPTWRVLGYDLKDGPERMAYGLSEPTAEERFTSQGTFELRFDAATLKPWNEPLWIE